MNDTAPGAYPADMLSALMNETLDDADAVQRDVASHSLQREVALLRGILDQANVWLDVLDSEGNVVLWNQAAEDISGYTREEVVGHGRIWDWLYPDPAYRQEIVEQAAAIIDGEAVQDFETTIRTKDGEQRVISWHSRGITDSDGDHIGSIALGRDITGRRRAEQKLEENERRYRTIVEHANDWIWTLDRDGRLTFANRAAQDESGYDLADCLGKDLSTFIHPDDLPHVREIFERVLQGEPGSYRVRIIDGDGGTIHLQVTSTPRWQDNQIVGTIAFGRNITEQVALEDRLQESEERYRAIVEQSHDAVAILQDEDILFASARLCELTGYSQERLDNMNLADLIHPGDRKHVREMMQRRMQGEASPSTFQARLRTREGDVRHGEFSLAAIFYGGETAVLASIRDVTERRRIEQRLRDSETRLRDMLHTSTDWIWEVDTDGRYTFVSGRVRETMGYTPDELTGTSRFSLMPEDEAQRMRDLFARKAASREPLVNVENRHVTRNGSEVIMVTNAVPIVDDDGALKGYRGTDRDITRRRQVEEEARQQQKLSHLLLNATHDMALLLDVDGTILTLNEAMAGSLGVERDEALGTDSRRYVRAGLIDQDIYDARVEKVREVQETGQPVHFEDRRRGRWFDSRVYPIFGEDGDVRQIATFVRDITERKQMEQELRESEEKYRTLVEHQGEGVGIVDTDETFTFANPAAAEIFGVDRGDLVGRNLLDFLAPEQQDVVQEQTEERKTGKNGSYNLEIVRPDGEKRVIAATVTPRFNENGGYDGAFGVFRDITEQRRMQRQLRKSERRYRELLNHANSVILRMDTDGNITYFNEYAERFFGWTEEEILGENVVGTIVPETETGGRELRSIVSDIINHPDEYVTNENENMRRNGDVVWMTWTNKVIYEDGEVDEILCIGTDITERKQMEENLKKNEEKFRSLAENATDGLYQVDENDAFVFVNDVYCKILGYTKEELLGKKYTTIIFDKDIPEAKHITRKASEGKVQKGEFTLKTKKGDGVPVYFSMGPRLVGGNKRGFSGIIHDITERKQMEDRLRAQGKRFRDTVNLLPMPYGEFDLEGNATFLNNTCLEAFHYTRKDFEEGLNVMQVIHPEDRERAGRNIQKILQGEKTAGFEYRFIRKDGSVFPCLVYSRPIRQEEKITGFKSVLVDITERKQMEQELRESQEKYSTLVEQGNDGIMIVQDYGLAYCNQKLLDMMGYTMEEIQDTSFLEYMEPPFATLARERYEKRMAGEEVPRMYEIEIKTKDGRSVPAEVNASVIEYRGRPADMAIVRDITERKQMEEELTRLSAAVEQSTEGYIITDLEGQIIYANSTIERLYGYTPGELVGEPVFRLNAASADSGEIQREFRDTGFWSGEIEQRRKDGSTFPALLSLFTVKNEDGNADSAVASVRDITERKQAQRELEEKQAYLENIINTVGDPLFVKNREHSWILLNDAYCDFMGYSREELLGKSDYDFFPEEEADVFWEKDEETFETGTENVNEEKFTDRQGTTHTVITRKKAYTSESGTQILVGTIHDVTEQKRAEQELREQKKLAQTMLDATHDVALLADIDGTILAVNEAMAEAMGDDREAIVGSHMVDRIGREAYAYRTPKVREVQRTKQPVEFTDEREGRLFSHRFYPVFDEQGTVRQVAVFSRDITERRQAEERYRRLVEASPELIAEVDGQGRFVTVNPAMARAFGCRPEDLTGVSAAEMLPDKVFRRRSASAREAIENGVIVEDEDERDGRHYHNLYIPIDVPGKGRHVQVIARDITQRKKTERALQESEAKFRSIFAHAPIGIALVDIEGRPVLNNPALRDMVGYSEEELASMTFPEFTHPDDVGKDLELYGQTKEGLRDEYSMEKRYICKDGTVVWTNLTVSIVRGEDGEPRWAVGMVEDITERKRAEEERRRQTQLAALGRIAAVVSHELNTPLANIALAADCLAAEHGLAGNEELDTIRRAVDNASSIVKQVLGFSRMDRMNIQPMDLASVVQEAVDAVRDTVSGEASIEVSVAPCSMLADEHHLYRAFVNVVKNAVLARESGRDGHQVSVASKVSGGEVVVSVADNGVGMDPDVQAKADQPFFTTRPPGEGTGLGLYVARWIVERHGGSIAIESQPGEGTTVIIRLPLREGDA
ncbi:MAG: PAS domain S-box protein [Thermoplasmatota archaeon]